MSLSFHLVSEFPSKANKALSASELDNLDFENSLQKNYESICVLNLLIWF